MSFDGREVANFVLDCCEENGQAITNLSLQKIVYFCHVWSLIKLGRPLVRHKFEAWEYGPVLQYLYREFKAFDRSPINGRAKKIDKNTGQLKIASYDFDEETKQLLASVIGIYSHMTAGQLVNISHVAGGPWERVWNHGGSVNPGMKIDDEDILKFYSKLPSPMTIQ